MNDDEMNAMAEAAAEFTRLAHEHQAGALVMYPYEGPPPPASFFLNMMREMIEETGEAMGCITLGCGAETGTLPLTDVHPVDALYALLKVRLGGLIPKVNWITVSSDTFVLKGVTEDDAQRGSAGEAFLRGDPNASEALMAMCMAPDGPGYDVHQSYVRSDDGVEWGEPEDVFSDQSEGDIPSLMSQIVLA